jgi:hypothetical protein
LTISKHFLEAFLVGSVGEIISQIRVHDIGMEAKIKAE